MDGRELIAQAMKARKHAYAPYSHFLVGAALLGKSGKIYTGCNVENASFSAGICAERTALVKAVSEGERSFLMLAVVGTGREKCFPCGICRQMLYEFASDLMVLCANEKGEFETYQLSQLLPCAFEKK